MNSNRDVWNEVLKILQKNLTGTAIDTWFSDCVPIDITDCTVVLAVKNSFVRDVLINRFSDQIKNALYELFACDFELMILAGEDEVATYSETKKSSKNEIPEMIEYTFDRFIVGDSNKFAYAAAKAVANHCGGREYNPLFIYGNSGLGKTHLLFAIAHSVNESDPSKKIAYVKGDEFTNKLVKSLQERRMDEFRNEFRNVDLFLIDDIQFIAGKTSTQEEFFNTFNAIYESGNQIVITSDRPPKEMSTLEDRLRSRFEGGILADIQPPDFETRVVITRNKAAQLGLVLSNDSVEYIANNVTANIRQIEGVIKSLTAYKEIISGVITPEYVKRAIESVTKIGEYIPSPERIITQTARYYNLSAEDIKGQNRSKNTTEARQIAMYLMRSLTNLSLKDIGEQLGRNHATVLSSIRKIEDLIQSDKNMAARIRDISSNINST